MICLYKHKQSFCYHKEVMFYVSYIIQFAKTNMAKNISYVTINCIFSGVTLNYMINDNNKFNKMYEEKQKKKNFTVLN
jgi:hypothetical protein